MLRRSGSTTKSASVPSGQPAGLVLGTYRPVDVIVSDHPLREVKAELRLHGLCREIELEYLTQTDVQTYVVQRLGESCGALTADMHHRSGGNPLFLRTLVDALQQRTHPATADSLQADWAAMANVIPERVQELILIQAEHLTAPELQVVEAASVSELNFTPTLIAAGLELELDEVETVCEELERQGRFLHAGGEVTWPDGSVETQYEFQHALQREALYQRVAIGRRRRLHRAMGERLEAGYGKRAKEVAAELALHFELGSEFDKAVGYCVAAALTALQRAARRETLFHVDKGLGLLATLPESKTRMTHELQLQMLRVQGFTAIKSHTAEEVEQAVLRGCTLCEQIGDVQQQLSL